MSELEPNRILPSEPLAVVGMACRLPGADNLDAFWDLMVEGRSGICEMPENRLDRRLYYSKERNQLAKTYSTISGMIPARGDDPSSDVRSINSEELEWDACHEILCGVVNEARLNAGWSVDALSQCRTGVYVGHACGSHLGGEFVFGSMIPEVADKIAASSQFQALSEHERHEILAEIVGGVQGKRPVRKSKQPQLDANAAAQRIAERFHLDGPQLVVDAACASSMIGLALAAAALSQGEIDHAIVCGASYSKADSLILFSQAQSCSADASRPFDSEADGLVNAEGYVALIIKSLTRAQADGDHVHAIIRGIGISSDGRGRSLWAPRKEGQLEAVRRAYSNAISKDSVQYVEAHATSTQVGDATELEALGAFFPKSPNQRKIPLGSVKSNIGHTLETAGLASLVKCILSMQKGLIPPSINLTKLNPTIDWDHHPFSPVRELTPWPDLENSPRRAAINAFGIGGLNAHVVVDGPLGKNGVGSHSFKDAANQVEERCLARPRSSLKTNNDAMAIIGRGVVLPGAMDMKAFRTLLRSQESQLVSPPAERWRDTPFSDTRPAIRQAYENAKGGYIRGYQYDWRKHKIPPLQIENANPLQFMLLDATQQALDESGYGTRSFDRSRAGVVVGTFFGGDFAHQLLVGMRIPEILDELTKALKHRNWDKTRIRQYCRAAEAEILKSYPAIKDQTGSFTCSTQASRVAKTLNIMGGAMAVDNGDCSGLAALQSAKHLLNSLTMDFVFCAAAQRDMDAAGFEAWTYRTVKADQCLDSSIDTQAVVPGEGVVVLLLRRHADAIAANDQIFGVIRDVRAGRCSVSGATSIDERRIDQVLSQDITKIVIRTPNESALTRQFGHLQGASGLLEIAGLTVMSKAPDLSDETSVVLTKTGNCEYQAVFDASVSAHRSAPVAEETFLAPATKPRLTEFSMTKQTAHENGFASSNAQYSASHSKPSHSVELSARTIPDVKIIRVWGVDESELRARLQAFKSISDAVANGNVPFRFPERAPYRLAIVASETDFLSKQQLALDDLNRRGSSLRAQEQGVFYCGLATEGSRLAAMFPGQGSQRSGMLSDLVSGSKIASSLSARADRALSYLGQSPCSDWMSGYEPSSENDLQSTQIAMLTADVCAFHVAYEWGVRPDMMVGHSFGEYAALVSAGALEFESAIAITVARAKAVAGCTHGNGAMLSISAPLNEVRPLLAGMANIFISHANAPRQTVVAGSSESVTKLTAEIKARGIAAVQIPVGSPFHTPLLEGARTGLKVALEQHRWRPPRIPLLSSVSGRFVADRDDIITNLTEQLIHPLYWVKDIERLLAEDVRVFLEVGPGRVLTKLTQQIIGDRTAFAIPMDNPSISMHERQLRVAAALEVVGIQAQMSASDAHRPEHVLIAADTEITRSPNTAVTEFADHSVEKTSSNGSAVNGASKEIASVVETQVSIETQTSSATADGLSEFLIDIIVEQTGYPRDVIELDWDMEADLGIDSIRKAQIFGELREYFEFTAESGITSLHQLRTIRDILNLLQESKGKGEWLQRRFTKNESIDVSDPGESELVAAPQSNDDSPGSVDCAESTVSIELSTSDSSDLAIDNFLIEFIVERTGYPRDVIELDADLEADLGIDSIAKAQMIGEVRDHFRLTINETSGRLTLNELRTLAQIRTVIKATMPLMSEKSDSDDLVAHQPLKQLNGHAAAVISGVPTIDDRGPHIFVPTSENDWSAAGEDFDVAEVEMESAFNRGREWGRFNRASLQSQLFDVADRAGLVEVLTVPTTDIWDTLTSNEQAELRGVANGANLYLPNLLSIRERFKFPLPGVEGKQDSNLKHTNGVSDHQPVEPPAAQVQIHSDESNASLTQRFRLDMSRAEKRNWSGAKPEFAGGAIVIGSDPDCDMLIHRLKSFGVNVTWLKTLGTREEALASLEAIWNSNPSPHLFILSPRDVEARLKLDLSRWKKRRETGITSLYWFCQKWFSLVNDANLLDDASLVGVTALGGDFGISNKIASVEGGAVTGLLKSILIEKWVNGYRTVPIKVLDLPADSSANALVDAICVEMTEPSYDVEIGWNGNLRSVLRSVPAPVAKTSPSQLVPSGNWIITGGARGITAFVVKQMAARFPGVHFHLIGTAPKPQLSDADRQLAQSDPAKLRANTMQLAKQRKDSPLKAWQAVEKAIEIDRSLAEFKSAGIHASYHSCDVADCSQLSSILDSIRQNSGPITGILHGAGIGKDASFPKKDPEMVERCLSAKLDGAINLMLLTQNDPLQAFIGFGSISGRFGANGHTDYSLSNDMLSKLVGWHRQLRPSVPSTVFHWHAWDDVGMATKPETRLALEMVGMQLMPAQEGSAHFLREIDAGLPLSEVVITDTRYYRMFYPADRMLASSNACCEKSGSEIEWPLIKPSTTSAEGEIVVEAVLNPVADPFLIEHRLRDRPVLPMVIMTELIAEAASDVQDGKRPIAMRDLQILTSLKFTTDAPCDVRLHSVRSAANSITTELRADFRSRNGKLISASRLYARAIVDFELSSSDSISDQPLDRTKLQLMDWTRAQYPPAGSIFYGGGPLQCLRKYSIDHQNKSIWGRISAPSLNELAGPQRDVIRWLTPSAVLDAALFTSGILSWNCLRPGVCLPMSVKQVRFYRCPRPAEVCWVRSQVVSSSQSEAVFDITVWGSDDRPLFVVQSYIAAWLPD